MLRISRLFHEERDTPADGLEFDLSVGVGRHADKDHVRLNLIVHVLKIGKGPSAARALHKGLGPFQDDIAKSRQFHILVIQEMAQMVFADSAASNHCQFFHNQSSLLFSI